MFHNASEEGLTMRKTHLRESSGTADGRKMINVKIDPNVNEGPASVRVMEKKIVRLTDTVKRQEDEITTLRQLLVSQDVIGHWEVPG